MAQIKMIVPGDIKIRDVQTSIDVALVKASALIRAQLDVGTAGWEQENKPAWKITGPRTRGTAREWEMSTESTPYLWVNDGTKGPYPIPKTGVQPPRRPLRFKTGYVPKTTPGSPFSSGPGVAVGPWRSAKQVMHPGIEPRDFTGQAVEDADDDVTGTIQLELNAVRSL
jgi:hypothetical protein